MGEFPQSTTQVVPRLIQALEHDADEFVRATSARSLDYSGPDWENKNGVVPEQAVPALLKALSIDHSETVRKTAAETLGRAAAARAIVVPHLERALKDPDKDVRNEAKWALKRLEEESNM